jgi:hypothetical protein
MTTYSNYHQIVEGIYRKHNPDKLADVPKLLDKYQGHELKLIESLFAKYNIGKNEQQQFFAVNTYVMPERETNASSVTAGVIVIAIVITCITGYVIFGNQPTHDADSSPENAAYENDNAPAVAKREISINEPYTVASKRAYFSLNPERNQSLSEYLYRGDNFTATKECNGYVYCEYTDKLGNVSKGWLAKQDIVLYRPTYAKAQISENETKEILNALKVPVEEALQQSIKFNVTRIQQSNGWAAIMAKPIQTYDSPVNYTATAYQAMIDDGTFDEDVSALLQLRNGSWNVVEYQIGGTDDPSQMWLEKHGLQHLGKALGLTQ